MYPKSLKEIENVAVRSRVGIERRIVRSLVKELLSHNHAGANQFELAVDDGEERHPRTADAAKLFMADTLALVATKLS